MSWNGETLPPHSSQEDTSDLYPHGNHDEVEQQFLLNGRESEVSTASINSLDELLLLCGAAPNASLWDSVRDWLRHTSVWEARLAAEKRGVFDTAPLHLACRNNAPVDVLEGLLLASPITIRWADAFGWLPLHYACANNASFEVLWLLVRKYPDAITSIDKNKKTPLHHALGSTERPAEKRVVELLSGNGALLFPDENEMLPLHYACAYGVAEEAFRVFTDDNILTVTAKDRNGRTPLHLAMLNADKPTSPAAVNLLLFLNPKLVDVIDSEGNLPIHLLAERALAIKENGKDKCAQCQLCLGYYLEANPRPSADLLLALQSLPDWLRDLAVVNPVVQRILNIKISKRFPTFVTLCDLFFQILVVFFFQKAVIESVADRTNGTQTLQEGYLIILYFAAAYFSVREIVQAVSLAILGQSSAWVWDATNWIDISYIILILFWTICMQYSRLSLQTFQIGAAITVMIYWVNILLFLKGIMVGFAVFVGGVVYVLKRLAIVFLSFLIMLLAFAQMFHTAYRMTVDQLQCWTTDVQKYINVPTNNEVCDVNNMCVTPLPKICEPTIDAPWCNFWTSLYKTYSMLLGEVDDNDFAGNPLATLLFALYMLAMVVVLANVLIAIVTDSYSVIKNERAAVVFWTNRLHFVSEMDVISSLIYNRCFKLLNQHTDENEPEDTMGITVNLWNQFMNLFDEKDNSRGLLSLIRIGIACAVIPLWLLLGAITFGLLWPPQVREFLLASRPTAVRAKGEVERDRSERILKLKQEVSAFHEEVRVDFDKGRDELDIIRIILETTKSEIQTEMKDVKRLAMELLETFDR